MCLMCPNTTLWKLVLFFYHESCKNWAQVLRLGRKHLYLLSHPVSPQILSSLVGYCHCKKAPQSRCSSQTPEMKFVSIYPCVCASGCQRTYTGVSSFLPHLHGPLESNSCFQYWWQTPLPWWPTSVAHHREPVIVTYNHEHPELNNPNARFNIE